MASILTLENILIQNCDFIVVTIVRVKNQFGSFLISWVILKKACFGAAIKKVKKFCLLIDRNEGW